MYSYTLRNVDVTESRIDLREGRSPECGKASQSKHVSCTRSKE